MIEANGNSLSEFLKTKNVAPVATNVINPISPVAPVPEVSPLQSLTSGMDNATDGIEKFTNLINAVSKLLENPMLSGVLGTKNIVNSPTPQNAQFREVPEGYLPVNNTIESKPLSPPTQPQNKVNNAEKIFMALTATIEELVKQNPERTIKSLYEEISQESVKEALIKQIEVLT